MDFKFNVFQASCPPIPARFYVIFAGIFPNFSAALTGVLASPGSEPGARKPDFDLLPGEIKIRRVISRSNYNTPENK